MPDVSVKNSRFVVLVGGSRGDVEGRGRRLE
jgi:hypothetical protein